MAKQVVSSYIEKPKTRRPGVILRTHPRTSVDTKNLIEDKADDKN